MARAIALTAPTTKCARIVGVVAGEIEQGKYKLGDLLPSEAELSRRFGVSRHTVRAALLSLNRMGLVSSRRGIGTEVTNSRLLSRYTHSCGSAADLLQYAKTTRVRFLDVCEVEVDRTKAAFLRCREGEHWWRLRTVRGESQGGAVVAYSEIHIPLAFGKVIGEARRTRDPIFALIERHFGETVTTIEQEIACAGRLSAEEAQHLRLPERSAGMQILRRYLGQDRRTLEVTRSVHPPEHFRYSMNLELEHGR